MAALGSLIRPARGPRFAAALLALAPQAAPPAPREAASASREWTLTLAPTEGDPNGPTELALCRAEAEVWRKTLDLGVREVLVSDAGEVVGFGYSGKRAPDYSMRDFGTVLRVFALAPDGATLVDESHPRGRSLYPDGHSNPMAAGCFLHPELGRFVVRVHDEDVNRNAEEWWAYDLTSGAVLFRERPKLRIELDPALSWVQDAQAVPRTPLVLVHWRLSRDPPRKPPEDGFAFQLVDSEWRVVWSREATDHERLSSKRFERLDALGATLLPAGFEIPLDTRGKKRARFTVRSEAGAWTVSEVEGAK